jgi:hypothetical protein
MLQPGNRLTLIDAMRPPPGHRVDAAMAVTFTLDLRALLAAPAAFALANADGVIDPGHHYEPIELIHSLRNHAGRITVFSQAGEIALPPSRRVFAFLEGCVVPVTAPRGGVVHPKVWVLRYVPAEGDGESRLRVLCASRNLTFDSSWDTLLRLDQTAGSRPGCRVDPIAELFDGLAGRSLRPLTDVHADRVASLCADLRTAQFELPEAVDELLVHTLGLERAASPLPAEADRCLILSPFVSDEFFTRVRPGKVDELVSRAETLAGLAQSTMASIGSTFCFDDGSTPELSTIEGSLSPADPGRPIRGLHAKVFAFEEGQRAQLFCGSANATGAAFGSNVEILVELRGDAARLGIDALCDGTADEPGLRSLFLTYVDPPEDDPLESNTALDRARRDIASVELDGVVEQDGDGWSVTYRTSLPLTTPAGVTIACWPLSTPGNRRDLPKDTLLHERFDVTIESLSGFVAFELIDSQSHAMTQFLVPATLTGVPEHRERYLLRTLIGNAERFLRYLLALLDEGQDEMELVDVVDHLTADQPSGAEAGGATLPVLEKLLRAMRRDPAKLRALHPLVTDLAADDALPPGFAALWSTIYDVAIEDAS